jgi:site-specific DNA-cytosine methylase
MAEDLTKSKLVYHVWDKDNNEYDIPDDVVQERGMDNFAKDFEGGYITMFDNDKQKVDVPIEDVEEYRNQGYLWYDASGNATPINEVGKKPSSKEKKQTQYPQEVIDAFNSPDNKPGNFKDLAQLNDEYQRGELKKPGIISQALGMFSNVDAGNVGKEQKVGGMIANMLLGDNMQQPHDNNQQVQHLNQDNVPATEQTKPTVKDVDAITSAAPVQQVDAIYNKYVGKGDALSETMYDLMASGQAKNQEEAQNMAMGAMNRAASRLAQRTTDEFVSKLGDTVEGVDEAVMNGWHSHAVQDNLKKLASQYGIMNNVVVDENGQYITQTNGYDQFINGMVKPAMVESLVNKYGENYRKTAEDLATRLYSNDEVIQNQLMNQDINDALSSVISKYVNPSVVDEYNKAQEAGSKAFTEGMEGSQFIPANLRLGTALGAQYEANEAKDPAKVLSSLQQKFGKLYRNPKFLNDMSNAAFKVMQRYGLNGTQSSDPNQFKPMINSVLKNELDQLEIKGMMPKGSAEYIMKTGLGNTIVGKITRKAVQTDYQNWLEDIANQQYQPGFWENVASGALTFAGDAWSYWLPGAAGGKLTKSMVAKAEGKLAGDLMAKGMERRMAARAAKLLIGKSKTEALKSGAVHGAVTFGGQSAISKPIDEKYRTGQFDENGKIYNPSGWKIALDTLLEGGKQSALGVIMQGNTIANMIGKGRGLATNILADIGGKVADSGIMTGHQMLERMAQDPNFKPTGKDAAESFLESMANLTAIGLPGMVGKYARFKDAREFNKKFDFTDQDIAELKRFGYDGLRDAFEKMGIGEYAVVGENAQRLDGQLTQKYMDLINDKSVPEVLKAKMMAVVEGKRPSSFSPVIDSEVYRGDDGKYYLETYNKDGGVIDRKEYSSHDAARNDEKKLEYEKTLGLASVLEGEFHNVFTQEHLNGLYNKAAQKYNMGEKLTDEDKAAVYLHQNAGAIKEIMDKQQKGIILTDEEQKQVNVYRHYYDSALENSSVMREFVNTFEDSHDVAHGTLRKALESKDKKYAPLVESYLKELYNSIELKREMKQTVDDLYNTSHGNEQKRIEGENPVSPVEGSSESSAGGQEPPVSEGPAPYQDRTKTVPTPSDAEFAANPANLANENQSESKASDAFVMGQNAYKNGDKEGLKSIKYNAETAELRLKRAFANDTDRIQGVYNAVNKGTDIETYIEQRTNYLTPFQQEAIRKYAEAMDANKGAMDALEHADDGYADMLKQQLSQYTMENGNISSLTLTDGQRGYWKSKNEHGAGFGVFPDANGQPVVKQVPSSQVKENGKEIPLQEYVNQLATQKHEATKKNFNAIFDATSLKPNDTVSLSINDKDQPTEAKIVSVNPDGTISFNIAGSKNVTTVPVDTFTKFQKYALRNSINAELDAEDDEREQEAASQAEADKKQRYANGIVGLSEGQPDYSSKDTDPKVAAEYLQEQFGEDHGKLLNLVNGSRDDIKTQLANKRRAAIEYQNWLDTNADLDPEKAKKVEDELSLVNEQLADLDARFKNWNTIRNSVMTPDEVKAMKEERKAEVEKAGVDESAIVPSDDFHVLVLDDKELKKQYPTMDKATDYITSQRKDIYHTQEDVERKINGVNDMLDQYINGETELDPSQLMELNTSKAQLEVLQTNLSVAAKGLKAQANKLSRLYKTEVSKQEMEKLGKTPSEQRKALVADALKKNDMNAIHDIYKDASVDVMDLTPQTLEEAVSESLLPHSLNPESLQYELGKSNFKFGIGKGYDSNKFNYLIAKKGTGMSVNEFAVRVYNDLPVNLQDMGYTDQDVRNALLDMFKSYDSVKEMRNVALMNRIAAAEDELSSEEEYYEAQKEREIIERQAEIEQYKSYIHEKELSLPSESELDHINGLEFDRMMEIEDREREYKQYVKSILPELADYDDRSNEEGYGGGSSLGSDSSRRGVDERNSQGEEVGNGEASSESEIGEGSDSGRKGRQETGSMEPGKGSAVRGSHLPQETSFGERLKSAIAETETEITEAQKKAGNYKKGHLSFGGYDYTVETPKGVTRSGKDEQGKPWSVTMHDTYGYILGKIGVDGDHIDMFINDAADLDTFDGNVYVVDQVNPETGEFDEHKVMYGYPSEEAATEAYLANYSKGWKGLGKVTSVPKATFDKWLESSDRKTKPFAEYAMVQKEQAKFDRDVKEVKPSEMTEAQKVAYDAVSTMLKKAGIPVKVVSNEDMEKVAEAQDNLAVEMLLNDPRLRFYIKTPEQKEAAKAAYDWAAKHRPDKFKQYAIVNMDNPNQPPQYFEKKDLAEKWRKYYTNAWKIGNYKAFNLNKPFEEQIKDIKGDVPSEFDPYKAESLLNKRIELEKQIKETEDSYNAKKKERAEYQNQLMQDYMDQHGLSSENDIPDDVWTDYRDKSFEKYQDTLDDLFHKYVELDNQLKAVAEPGVQYLKGKGVVYGYTDGKEIVLNQEHLNPNTPIHEYQHLWRTAAKNMNPELIEHGDKLIMQTQLFADLKKDPNYNHLTDEQICDEAFARLTGEDGAAILEQMAKDAIKENPLDTAKELSVINKLKEWLKKFWYWTLDTFTKWKPEDIKKMTLEDIRNLVLRDLANGVDPRTKLHEAENADDIKFMGSTTKKRMKDISTQLEGRELDEAQQAVADVYSGKKDNVSLTVEREDGSNKIIMRQGNDNHAGTKHSVFRHYGVKANSLNVDDLLLIPTVLKEGERKVSDNGRVAYVYVDPTSQVKYTVVTEPKNNKEFFNDFYSNKKANPSETSRVVENSTNTPEGAHNNDGNAFMDAKVDNNSETAKGNGENLSVEDKIKAVSQQFGVDEADVAMYANAIKKGSTAEAARARANIKRHLMQVNEGNIFSFKDMVKYTVPVNNALKENFGDLDAMIEERIKQVEAERNAMEAARKRAEEEEAKRKKHLEELSLIPDVQLDKQYMDALAKGDDATAREMLDEAARRKGYDDTESSYQGVGAWKAPGNPGYESDKARRDDWESSGSDVNLEDMALGYTPQPDDYFSHPERYSQNTPHGLESVKAINAAIDAIKNGEKDVKVKVYRAVPTSVKESKLRNGDWVTPSKKYAEMHGTNRLEGKYRIIEDEVPANQLWWDGNDANEFGFDDGKEYKYKNAKNNRKLNDLVTYDDKGDVIPPSKRFNSRKSDVRFHRVTEVKSPIVEQKLQKHPDSLMKAGTYFSGGGLVEEGLKGIIDPVVAVEYDRKISGVYRNNFGQHIVTADVRDVDPKELVKHIDGEVEYFHASPVCKNYSQAKSNSGEVELDKETAKSTADFIDAVKPRVVTIENVKGYKDSEAMKIITRALDKNGYTWDSDVYNAADYGGYTSRERLIVRAVKDGELPEKPNKQPHKGGWLEAVEDILPTLTVKESGVAPWMDARLKADGIDWQKVEKPLYVMGSAYADGKIPHAYGDEILPTLRTKSGDVIIMPGGKVLRADGRVLARITGLGDDYKLPKTESLAHTIIGNGIPVQLTQGVIAPLLNKDDLSGRNVLARLGSSIFKNNWDADKQKQVSDRVVNTANKLGGAEATVYTSVDEVPDAYLSDVKNGATGWYDPTTHTVHVYLPNCADVNEAERTVLHEKIGHEGMEVLLGGENEVRKFANFVYRSASKDVRGKIIDFANKYDPDWKNNDRINVGTQEYIAHLAEEGPKTAEDFSLWTKIKHYLIKVLKKLGVRVPGLLNDKDLRYYLMKAGKALHVWDEMPQEKQEAMMKQASNAEIKDALSDGANLPSEEDNKPKKKTERGRIDEATGAFKLAPNGEQSNLSKKQYIEARTKNFKDWFGGDWEKKPKDFKNKLDANGEPLEKYVEGYLNRPKKPTMPKKRKGEDEATFFGRKMLYSQALEDWPKTEADWKKRIDEFDENTLAALTPPDEEAIREKYQKQYENDMASWRKDHPYIKEGEERPFEIPDMRDYQSLQDYGEALRKHEIWKTAPHKDEYDRMAEDEIISKVALMDAVQHPFSEYARLKAMKAEFQHMRHVMQNQKVYDQNTTDAVVQFAKRFMSLGYGDDLGRGSINTLLTIVKNSSGKKSYEISQQLYQVMDVLMNNQLRNFDRAVMKTMSIKELKENAKGIQVQGKLELRGQTTIKAFRDAVSSRISSDKLDEKISNLIDKMAADKKNASSYQDELLGLNLAKQYVDYIDSSRNDAIEIEDLKKLEIENYKDRKGIYKGERTKALLQEHVERLNQYDEALFNNKVERMDRYSQLLANLGGMIDESVKGAREFQERDARRAINVKMMASADLGDKSMNQHHKENWKTRLSNSDVARLFCSPLGSFDALMREFGSKQINGEGQLWNHFVRGAMKASNDVFKSVREANNEIDLKVSELFGKVTEDKNGNKKGNMTLNDLYALERSNKVKSLDVTIRDIEGEQTYKLQQGNLMYIYMVNKMPDGAMKLREMRILDADVERIKENIDPRFLKLADWIQGEFLPKMRTKYNKRHEELFGAPMPMVENYFPLRVLKNARYMEEDVNNTSDGSNALPSTATGAIIKRKTNKLPLDILNADALSVTIDNIKEMENWYNYAPIRKDANTLLSDTTFRNRVQNMTTIYGSGERLWNNVKDATAVAMGTYRPKGGTDLAVSIKNIGKGITGAKISGRLYTAFKQILSFPLFLADADLGRFAWYSVNPYGSFKWAIENMPNFDKRWSGRKLGDTVLMDDPTDWKLWHTNLMEKAAYYGMTPNALVDAVTCAVGARAVYDTKYKQYIKAGLTEERAKEKALSDAEINFNTSQQSSEGAFVSPMQLDRTLESAIFTPFRNSSMLYERKGINALRNLKHRFEKGHKEASIKYMAAQLMEEGVGYEQATKAAEKMYKKGLMHNIADAIVALWLGPIIWNLGGSLGYLIPYLGDDENKKKKMVIDAVILGLLEGPVDGLAGGQFINTAIANTITSDGISLKGLKNVDFSGMPMLSDFNSMIEKFGYDKVAGAQDLMFMVMQSGTGFNPKTLTDAINACIDYGNGDMTNAKEIALFVFRLMNGPAATVDNLYIDELGMKGKDAKKLSYEELAKRYAEYKFGKNTFGLGKLYSDEEKQKKLKAIEKSFDKKVSERLAGMDREDLKNEFSESRSLKEKKLIGKIIADELETKDSEAVKKAKADASYLRQRNFSDLMDDLYLQKEWEATNEANAGLEELKGNGASEKEIEAYKTKHKADLDKRKAIQKARKKMQKKKADISSDNDEATMAAIRKLRDSILKTVRQTKK